MAPGERQRLLDDVRRERSQMAAQRAPFDRLTPREAQVLRALAEGASAGALAARWFVSLATIRAQIRSVLVKLEVNSQLEAVARAHRAGWLDSGD